MLLPLAAHRPPDSKHALLTFCVRSGPPSQGQALPLSWGSFLENLEEVAGLAHPQKEIGFREPAKWALSWVWQKLLKGLLWRVSEEQLVEHLVLGQCVWKHRAEG